MRAPGFRTLLTAVLVALAFACNAPQKTASSEAEAPPPVDGSTAPADDECGAEAPFCTGHASRQLCSNGRWQTEQCDFGSGCYRGECTANACSDECPLGAVAGGRQCVLFDISTGKVADADPNTSLHERARDYLAWARRDGTRFGGIGNAKYSDPPIYSEVESFSGIYDSAIWTGTLLAAESMRLMETGSADARAHVIDLVNTLHLWFNVTGHPGLLARYAIPTNADRDVVIKDMDCDIERVHCGVSYQGELYDYAGLISRDQYQGVLLGYATAYRALDESDEATRKLIREDVLELIYELMKERSVPAKVTVDGISMPTADIKLRFVVLDPELMTDEGAIRLEINTGNVEGGSKMRGFQEFTPNLADIARQVPGLGWVPDIPRRGSAVMLAAAFRVAMLVTADRPEHADDFDAIRSYYLTHDGPGGNVHDWLDIADISLPPTKCGDNYYGNNIMMQPMYNLTQLEDDPQLRERITASLLDAKIWPEYRDTKNSYFSFIYSAAYSGADPAVVSQAIEQLAGFPVAPRVHHSTDLLSDPRYEPHDPECPGQTTKDKATDVSERAVSDFIWQRNPWELYHPGKPGQTYPGVDYLAAYWMGRHHDFIEDDSAGYCTIWQE